LQVVGQLWSEGLQKWAVWLGGLLAFEHAEDVLGTVGQVSMSDTALWRQVQIWGERGRVLESRQRAEAVALPARSQIVPGEVPQATVKGVALDGATVNIRREGWKELKVGSVFEVEIRPTRDRATGDLIDLAHAVQNTYVAHLGGPEVFGQLLWAEARRRNWTQVRETVALGDGALWIWNLVGEHFYDSRQVVDWYHAATHLRQAANALKGEHTPEAQRWFKAYDTQLFEGHADQIAVILRDSAKSNRKIAEVLRREAGYFDDNQRRMQYQQVREEGLPMGSGMVESACKQFRARLVGPGMRWSRSGAERMLPIRAAVMNRNFDAWWQSVSALPLN
jgi:hypothetical protein